MPHDFPKFMFDIGIRFSKYMKPTYRIVDKMLFYAVKIAYDYIYFQRLQSVYIDSPKSFSASSFNITLAHKSCTTSLDSTFGIYLHIFVSFKVQVLIL